MLDVGIDAGFEWHEVPIFLQGDIRPTPNSANRFRHSRVIVSGLPSIIDRSVGIRWKLVVVGRGGQNKSPAVETAGLCVASQFNIYCSVCESDALVAFAPMLQVGRAEMLLIV
jgi:hypothetical protein